MIADGLEDHAEADLQRKIRDQLVGDDAAKEDGGRGEGLEGVVVVVGIFVKQAVDHAGEDVLVEGLSRVLVAIEDLNDVPDLDLISIHLLIMLLHLAVGSRRQGVPVSPVGVDGIVETFAVVDQSRVNGNAVALDQDELGHRGPRQEFLEDLEERRDGAHLEGRARLGCQLALGRALVFHLEGRLDHEELQEGLGDLGAPVGVPPRPLAEI